MEVFVVHGGRPLSGLVTVAGAKNAVLVELASLLLIPAISVMHNVPDLSDVHSMIDLLGYLGCSCTWDKSTAMITVDARTAISAPVPVDLLQSFRASILIVGPLLARFGSALVSYPGGCPIGARPIDFHLKAFERMGARVTYEAEGLRITSSEGLIGADIVLEYPSVGATENIILAALGARGNTVIHNAAIEPEIIDLIALLNRAGATISCHALSAITIIGSPNLQAVEHTVLPDRLEAGTYLAAAAATGGEVTIPNISGSLLLVFIEKLREMGHVVTSGIHEVGVRLVGNKHPHAVSFTTMPYPGFPTDLQALMTTLQMFAKGESMIHETVFEKRLSHLQELAKMGVLSTLQGDRAVMRMTGEEKLQAADLVGTDIRGAAGLVIGALAVGGRSTVAGVRHIRRGYVAFEEKLQSLGADIVLGNIS